MEYYICTNSQRFLRKTLTIQSLLRPFTATKAVLAGGGQAEYNSILQHVHCVLVTIWRAIFAEPNFICKQACTVCHGVSSTDFSVRCVLSQMKPLFATLVSCGTSLGRTSCICSLAARKMGREEVCFYRFLFFFRVVQNVLVAGPWPIIVQHVAQKSLRQQHGLCARMTHANRKMLPQKPRPSHRFQTNCQYVLVVCTKHLRLSLKAIRLECYIAEEVGRRACTRKIFTRDVSVLSRSCLGDVLVSQWCPCLVFS